MSDINRSWRQCTGTIDCRRRKSTFCKFKTTKDQIKDQNNVFNTMCDIMFFVQPSDHSVVPDYNKKQH